MSPGTLETAPKFARQSVTVGRTEKQIGAASLNSARPSINAGSTRKSVDLDPAQRVPVSAAKRSASRATASGTVPVATGTGKFCSIHKGEPLVEPPVVEEVPPDFCEGEEPPHFGFGRVLISGFLRGQLERLHVFSLLPDANLSPELCIKLVPENDQEKYVQRRKLELIEAADKMHTLLWRKPPVSKFCVELDWLRDILQATLTEIEDSGTFTALLRVYEEDEIKEAKLPASIEHERELKADMINIVMLLDLEAAAQRALDKEWKKTLQHLRQVLKDLKKANAIAFKYKTDKAIATADCNRRGRDLRLAEMKTTKEQLKVDLEAEKKVHTFAVEFLKKQNMALREEAITLAAGIELDSVNLDSMLKRLGEQRDDKQKILDELEPRYLQHVAEQQAKADAKDQQRLLDIEMHGVNEMRYRSTMKIQKIWRGHLGRLIARKERRKAKKKAAQDKKNKGKGKGGKGQKKPGRRR